MFCFFLSVTILYFVTFSFGDPSVSISSSGCTSIYCLDESECADETLSYTYAYCYGYRGCFNTIISGKYSFCEGYKGCSKSQINSTVAASCDSEYSCIYNTINSDKYVYCDGKYSCKQGDISCGDSMSCDAIGSCSKASISLESGSGSLSCGAEFSCWYGDINLDTEGDMVCDGEWSCCGANIKNEYSSGGGDIYCDGDASCYYSESISTNGDIYCNGNSGCVGVESLSSAGDIYCDGEMGCSRSTIESSDNVYCNGDMGCIYNDIYNTSTVYTYGYYGSRFSTINTTGLDTFEWYLGGYKSSFGAILLCDEETTCNVYCESDTACFKLKMYCYGECEYECDDCYECPTIYDLSDSSTLSLDVYKQRIEDKKSYLDMFSKINSDKDKIIDESMQSLFYLEKSQYDDEDSETISHLKLLIETTYEERKTTLKKLIKMDKKNFLNEIKNDNNNNNNNNNMEYDAYAPSSSSSSSIVGKFFTNHDDILTIGSIILLISVVFVVHWNKNNKLMKDTNYQYESI